MKTTIAYIYPFLKRFIFVVILIVPQLELPFTTVQGVSIKKSSSFGIPTTNINIIPVNTLDDLINNNGDCSLREAITAANTNTASDRCPAGKKDAIDTITFLVKGTIHLTDTLPAINSNEPLSIDGVYTITVSGNNNVRVLYIKSGADLTLQNLAISDGNVICCDLINGTANGGGIYNLGTLTIKNVSFVNNSAQGGGGGLYSKNGTLFISNSTFSENTSDHGGALETEYGTTTINASSFHNNKYLYNPPPYGAYGGAISSGGTLYVSNSTFYSNQTDSEGGAIWINLNSNATIENTTFSGNSVTGLYGEGGAFAIANTSKATVNNSTFIGNSAILHGGAINVIQSSLKLTNSIVAFSQGVSNCAGSIKDGGYNLDSGSSCGFLPANQSINNADPLVGLLENNGGPTLTHALKTGSPAINTANCTTGTQTDQRDILRPQQASCDIGAYEATTFPFVMVKDDSFGTQEDTSLTINSPGVLWNDYGQDGPTLSISSSPSHGSVQLNFDGSFTYTPEHNYFGTDQFEYTASIEDISDVAVVTLTIYPVDDPPIAKKDTFTTPEDTSIVMTTQDLIANDENSDNDFLTIPEVSNSKLGILLKILNGIITYTPAPNYFGSDSFTYTVSDGFSTSQATVSIKINSINDAPVAEDDFYRTGPGKKLVVLPSGVLSNDTDIEKDPLTAVLATSPLNGTLIFNVDGSFSYIPDKGFTGIDQFTYKARDLQDSSNIATIKVRVDIFTVYLPNLVNQ